MNRRQFLSAFTTIGAAAFATSATAALLPARWLNPCLADLPQTPEFSALLKKIFQGIDASQVWDCHVHIVGSGDSNAGIEHAPWLNPDMDSWLHPVLRVQKFFYINGSCLDANRIDASYVQQMERLMAQLPAGFKAMLFAFDWQHDEQGNALHQSSIFHIPNRYAAKLAHSHPSIFEWVASIHPYRADCVDALQQAHAEGARAIKWLPSAMAIDPQSKLCERFYRAAADLKLPIICHTGREQAVQGGNQDFGNPLRLRRALDAGVRLVLAHCASDGEDIDLDKGAAATRVKSYELFARLMDEAVYAPLLYADISAITLRNHAWVIKPLLERRDWHNRLLNGSDYPLPGVLPLFNLDALVADGLLAADTVPLLEQWQYRNPLLFDFALKRLLQLNGQGFPVSVFETRRFFAPAT